MGNTKSTEKILEYVEEQDNPITLTKIVKDLMLSYKTARESLALLERVGKIQIITNGRTSLIMINNCEVMNR